VAGLHMPSTMGPVHIDLHNYDSTTAENEPPSLAASALRGCGAQDAHGIQRAERDDLCQFCPVLGPGGEAAWVACGQGPGDLVTRFPG
jgi:hypothetical protein